MRKSFIIALILAILPFALLGAGQAVWRMVRAHDAARDGLVAAAQAATGREANILAGAEALLRSMASQEAVARGGPDCAEALGAAIGALSHVTNISRLDASGTIICSARPVAAAARDRSGQDWWQLLQQRQAFIISAQHGAATTGQQVLTAAIALFTADGQRDGALALGISADFLAGLMRDRRLPDGAFAALIDRHDRIIASTSAPVADALFATPPESDDGRLKRAPDAEGRVWLIAIAPIGGGDLRLAFAERETALFAWSYVDVAATIALPLVMAAFAFVAIWYAANRFVLRWISYLERVARAYGKGHFALRPADAAAAAPPEIRLLANAMGEMAENIRERDARLRSALDQRTMMLREIHHRVKNNLQIVGSLLQIEARQIEEPSARAALSLTLTRINAIALAHRVLEEVGAQTVVNLRRLLNDLSHMLQDAFGPHADGEAMSVSAPDILIETDIAVPLALLLVEQVSVISRAALAAGQAQPGMKLSADGDNEQLQLTIAFADPGHCGAAHVRSPFADAHLRQLRAQRHEARDGERTVLRFTFPARTAFADAQPQP